MSQTEKDLEILCKVAKELGATNAVPFNAKDVVVDERVRLKCLIPPCKDYRTNLMCPPYVMSVKEFREVLSRYEWAILIQVETPIKVDMKNEVQQTDDVAGLYRNKKFLDAYIEGFGPNFSLLHHIVNKVEAQASMMGYRFATGFKAGTCTLCPECIAKKSKETCRHPFQSRPSMEAVGIDVFKTVETAGLPVDFPPKDNAVWNGLILIN
ncbi:DUF2284 domain-containing protein [Thermoproteota archaeon]